MRFCLYLLAVISVAMSMTTPPPDAEANLEGGAASMASMMNTAGQSGRGMMGQERSMMSGGAAPMASMMNTAGQSGRRRTGQGRGMMSALGSLLGGGENPLRSIFVLGSENENLHQIAGMDCVNNPFTATGQIDPFCVMLRLKYPTMGL